MRENTKAITRLESEYEFEQEKQQLTRTGKRSLRRQRYFRLPLHHFRHRHIFIFIIARYRFKTLYQ